MVTIQIEDSYPVMCMDCSREEACGHTKKGIHYCHKFTKNGSITITSNQTTSHHNLRASRPIKLTPTTSLNVPLIPQDRPCDKITPCRHRVAKRCTCNLDDIGTECPLLSNSSGSLIIRRRR